MHIFAIMCALNALSVQMMIALDCSREECHMHGWVTQTDEFSSKCVRAAVQWSVKWWLCGSLSHFVCVI